MKEKKIMCKERMQEKEKSKEEKEKKSKRKKQFGREGKCKKMRSQSEPLSITPPCPRGISRKVGNVCLKV